MGWTRLTCDEVYALLCLRERKLMTRSYSMLIILLGSRLSTMRLRQRMGLSSNRSYQSDLHGALWYYILRHITVPDEPLHHLRLCSVKLIPSHSGRVNNRMSGTSSQMEIDVKSPNKIFQLWCRVPNLFVLCTTFFIKFVANVVASLKPSNPSRGRSCWRRARLRSLWYCQYKLTTN